MTSDLVSVNIRFSGLDHVEEILAGFEHRIRDTEPLWERLKSRFVDYEAATFDAEGGASGHWASLSEEYGRWKNAHFPGMPILQRGGRDSERLMASLTHGLRIDDRSETSATFGTDVSYAHFHQDGTERMPRRPVIDLDQHEIAAWHEEIADHVMGRHL